MKQGQVARTNKTYAINLVECLPVFLMYIEIGHCLDGAFQKTRPYVQIVEVLVVDELSQSACKLLKHTSGIM